VVWAAFILSASSAFAATVTVHNSLDTRLSLAFYCTDRSGNEVTQGWWHVEPGAEIEVTLDADESKPVYYAAFNKDLYADSSTLEDPQVQGWLSYKNFSWNADVGLEPDEPDAFASRFFKVPENGVVDVDGNSRDW
jgi:hypothetical protein